MASSSYLGLEKLWASTVVSGCSLLSYASDPLYAGAQFDRKAYGLISRVLELVVAGTLH
jgi:hypothetical protein